MSAGCLPEKVSKYIYQNSAQTSIKMKHAEKVCEESISTLGISGAKPSLFCTGCFLEWQPMAPTNKEHTTAGSTTNSIGSSLSLLGLHSENRSTSRKIKVVFYISLHSHWGLQAMQPETAQRWYVWYKSKSFWQCDSASTESGACIKAMLRLPVALIFTRKYCELRVCSLSLIFLVSPWNMLWIMKDQGGERKYVPRMEAKSHSTTGSVCKVTFSLATVKSEITSCNAFITECKEWQSPQSGFGAYSLSSSSVLSQTLLHPEMPHSPLFHVGSIQAFHNLECSSQNCTLFLLDIFSPPCRTTWQC